MSLEFLKAAVQRWGLGWRLAAGTWWRLCGLTVKMPAVTQANVN